MTDREIFRGAVLVGFMGAGKSSVGKELAGRLGAEFVDVDDRIEAAAGRTVRDIFSSEGEGTFREMERDAIREAVSVPGRILATGGGAFADAGNRRLLKAYAPVFYLRISPDTVFERLAGDPTRPLLAGAADAGAVREILKSREPAYAEADFTVVAERRTVAQVADAVMKLLDRRKGQKR
jgi:shikimate kinase